jgi:hypothetical protein
MSEESLVTHGIYTGSLPMKQGASIIDHRRKRSNRRRVLWLSKTVIGPVMAKWYCCPRCRRLWTYQGKETVALDPTYALGPALPTERVPTQVCAICEGGRASVATI